MTGTQPFVRRSFPRLLTSPICEDAAQSIGLADERVSLQNVFFEVYAAQFPAGFDRLVMGRW